MSTNLSAIGMVFEALGYHVGPFVASIKPNKRKFHLPTCKYAAGFHAGNSRTFYTRPEAIAAGYRSCGTCNS